jgi:FkbM family methyltransferase
MTRQPPAAALGLEVMLAEDVASAGQREACAYDRLAEGRDIVLMGAGGLGRRTLAGLRENGIAPLAFADNDPARQGTSIDGIAVLSPIVAAQRFGSRAAFVVTIWGAASPHRYAHSRVQLLSLGCDCVLPFTVLYWKYPKSFLPYYLQDLPSRVLASRDHVSRALQLWEDDASRAEYISQIGFRLTGDFDQFGEPAGHPQYFPSDLFDWQPGEVFVDGGAYDGDTVAELSRLYGDRFRHVLAIEPDPDNFARLTRRVASLPATVRAKVRCERVALGSRETFLGLDARGTAASSTRPGVAGGDTAVRAVPLDALCRETVPTIVKLDIEGAEPDALEGARGTIVENGPVLAVCVYHAQDHLWRLPLSIDDLRDDYAFFLRAHNQEGWDLVCYAVPRCRLTWR